MGKRRYDLESNEMEQMCLEAKQHRCASFFVSCLYCPPNMIAAFFEHLTRLVELISAEAKDTILLETPKPFNENFWFTSDD